jgi:hypothetical protein
VAVLCVLGGITALLLATLDGGRPTDVESPGPHNPGPVVTEDSRPGSGDTRDTRPVPPPQAPPTTTFTPDPETTTSDDDGETTTEPTETEPSATSPEETPGEGGDTEEDASPVAPGGNGG